MRKVAILFLIFSNLLFGQLVSNSSTPINGEKYITGEDGVVRMYVNVWGHVKVSGTFLIFEGADIINALSIAGGPMDGANLKEIKIISKETGASKTYDIKNLINHSSSKKIKLQPYDTIIVQQTASSRILARSSLISAIFQLVNLLYTVDKLD